MASYDLEKLPLAKVLEEVKDLIAKGYDPMHFLSQFLISDSGARLRKA